VIDPPRSGPDFAGVFGCTDFAQPGTDSPSLAVLAGHSSRKFDTAFNKLYVQGAALVGQTVYLRTTASGDRWLAYRIERTFTPDKDQLPYLTAVWGGDGSSTSGRLVLVTCQQNETSTTSTANYVAVAQFEGVV
jgi:sortase (surface protein transpeptidase)